MSETLGHGIVIAHTDDMDRLDWLAERTNGIGGSDLPGIVGVSRYKTPLGVYLDKVDPVPEQQSESASWGHRLEPFVANELESRTGVAINEPRVLVRHPEHHWMLGNIDRVSVEDELIEIKTRRHDKGWEEGPPSDVELQVRHYLAVTGFDQATVATLFYGQELRTWDITRDLTIEADIIQLEAEFWDRVTNLLPPAAAGDDGPNLGRIFADASHEEVDADQRIIEALQERAVIDDMIKPLAAKRKEIDSMLKEAIGSKSKLMHQGRKVASWSVPVETTSVNIDGLTEAHPAIVAEFTETHMTSRRLWVSKNIPTDDDAF